MIVTCLNPRNAPNHPSYAFFLSMISRSQLTRSDVRLEWGGGMSEVETESHAEAVGQLDKYLYIFGSCQVRWSN